MNVSGLTRGQHGFYHHILGKQQDAAVFIDGFTSTPCPVLSSAYFSYAERSTLLITKRKDQPFTMRSDSDRASTVTHCSSKKEKKKKERGGGLDHTYLFSWNGGILLDGAAYLLGPNRGLLGRIRLEKHPSDLPRAGSYLRINIPYAPLKMHVVMPEERRIGIIQPAIVERLNHI